MSAGAREEPTPAGGNAAPDDHLPASDDLARLLADAEQIPFDEYRAWFHMDAGAADPVPGWVEEGLRRLARELPIIGPMILNIGISTSRGGVSDECHRDSPATPVKIFRTNAGDFAICLHDPRHVIKLI